MWPDVVELKDITISPLLQGSSKGYMALNAEPATPLLGHYRYGMPESVLEIMPFTGPNAVAARIVEEPVIYGGLMFRHFGHALTEGIHRLWPRYARRELHGAKVAFNMVNNSKILPYMTEALNFHGFSRSDVIPIREPTLFRRLFVGPQARQMAGPTLIPGYQTMLDRDLGRRLPEPGRKRRLYVSRLHHHHTGSFYGESFVEAQLAACGYEIIYPERLSLTELVILLRDASLAVFAEGSAVHALELCGSTTPAVFVIGRRHKAFDRFAPLLRTICSKWHVAEHHRGSGGMSTDAKKHSSIVDLSRVMEDIWSFADHGSKLEFDRADALAGIKRDLAAHIADVRNDRTDDYQQRARDLLLAVDAMMSSQSLD